MYRSSPIKGIKLFISFLTDFFTNVRFINTFRLPFKEFFDDKKIILFPINTFHSFTLTFGKKYSPRSIFLSHLVYSITLEYILKKNTHISLRYSEYIPNLIMQIKFWNRLDHFHPELLWNFVFHTHSATVQIDFLFSLHTAHTRTHKANEILYGTLLTITFYAEFQGVFRFLVILYCGHV